MTPARPNDPPAAPAQQDVSLNLPPANRLVLLAAGTILVGFGFLAAIKVALLAGAAASWPDDAGHPVSVTFQVGAVLLVAAVSVPALVLIQRVAVALLARAAHRRPGASKGWRYAGLLVLAAFFTAALLVGVADAGRTTHRVGPRGSLAEQRAVLAVARAGRRAILRDHPEQVCALLTPSAQQNSLILYGLNRDYSGHKRPKATTCVQAVGYMIDDIQISGELRQAIRHPGQKRFEITRIQGNRARLRMGRGTGADCDIVLIRTPLGWRADYATFAPFDGSSGY